MPSLFLSIAVTLAMAPLVRHLLLRRGVIDVPNQRSSHSVPVPRGGGIACLAGAAAGVVLAAIVHDDVPWLALGGVALLALVGYVDDRGTLDPAPRLGAQIAVGALVASAFGGAFWILAGAVCLPVLVNAVNFMDGINGITGLNIAR